MARAGVWFVTMVVAAHIAVFSAASVARNFSNFTAALRLERPDGGVSIRCGKYDIDNYFPSIPRELVKKGLVASAMVRGGR